MSVSFYDLGVGAYIYLYIYICATCMCAGLDGVRVIYINLGIKAICVFLYIGLSPIPHITRSLCYIYKFIYIYASATLYVIIRSGG